MKANEVRKLSAAELETKLQDLKKDNVVSLYDSSKSGKRSFGRFSRPLLEDTFAIIICPPLQRCV